MTDQYWRYNDAGQPQPQPQLQPQLQQQPQQPLSLVGKRPRSEYDVSAGGDMAGYYSHEDNRVSHQPMRDTESIDQSYDRYLRSGQVPYPGSDSARLHSSSHPADDPRMGNDPRLAVDPRMINDPRMAVDPRMGSDPRMAGDPRMLSDPRMANVMDPGMPAKGRSSNFVSGRQEVSLPPDASSILFVEGLPYNCTRREVAHIFRPFVGYKEVRLVTKESRRPGGDPLVLCFVDFVSPPHAATALDALHGYKFDENDRDSNILRLQFARHGARPGGGHRGKR